MLRWVGHVARRGQKRLTFKVLVEKAEGDPPGSLWYIWGDNIKINFTETGSESAEWNHLTQYRAKGLTVRQ
jgi:hypothetical protein